MLTEMEEESLKQFPQAQDTHLQLFTWPNQVQQVCSSHHMQLIMKVTTRLVNMPFKDKVASQHWDTSVMPNCYQNSKCIFFLKKISNKHEN